MNPAALILLASTLTAPDARSVSPHFGMGHAVTFAPAAQPPDTKLEAGVEGGFIAGRGGSGFNVGGFATFVPLENHPTFSMLVDGLYQRFNGANYFDIGVDGLLKLIPRSGTFDGVRVGGGVIFEFSAGLEATAFEAAVGTGFDVAEHTIDVLVRIQFYPSHNGTRTYFEFLVQVPLFKR